MARTVEMEFDADTYQPLPVYKPTANRAQIEKALALQTRLVADLERVLGLDHPATLAAKKTLEAG